MPIKSTNIDFNNIPNPPSGYTYIGTDESGTIVLRKDDGTVVYPSGAEYLYQLGDVDSSVQNPSLNDTLIYDGSKFVASGVTSDSQDYVSGYTYNKEYIDNLEVDLSGYYTSGQTQDYVSGYTYNKEYIDNLEVDLSGYYTSGQTDILLGSKVDLSVYNSYTGTTDSNIQSNTDDITSLQGEFDTFSGETNTSISSIESSLNNLETDFNTYTGTTAPNTYTTESWVSGFTYDKNYIDNLEVDLSGYTLQSDFNTYTGTTAPNTFTTESWVSGFTYDKNYIDSISGTTDLSNYYTSGQTDSLLDDKVDITSGYGTITNGDSQIFKIESGSVIVETKSLITSRSYQIKSTDGIDTNYLLIKPTTTTSSKKISYTHIHTFDDDDDLITKRYVDDNIPDTSVFTLKTTFETYTGTTAPNTYTDLTTYNSYTGTTDGRLDDVEDDIEDKQDKLATILSTGSTTYPLTDDDLGKILEFTTGTTVVLNSGLTNGFQCDIMNLSDYTLSLSGTTTLYTKDDATDIADKYSGVSVYWNGTRWIAVGNLS